MSALALVTLAGCPKGKLPGGGGLPNKPDVPGGLGGDSGMVDPNTCGNYAASEAGARLKAFLTATQKLQAKAQETVEVVKTSCVMMGTELGMVEADLKAGETKDVCAKVITAYQENLKVGLKAGAKLKIVYKPAVCKVDAQAEAKAVAECEGSAKAGTGGSGGSAECKAAGSVNASLDVQCTEPEFSVEADAKVVVDKSKIDMTLKALRTGLPKLLSVKARVEPLVKASATLVASAQSLAEMGPKFAQSFADQAMCISGQIAASVRAATQIQANVSVSVEVSASASGSVGG